MFLYICRECHDEIEEIIKHKVLTTIRKLNNEDYIKIAKDFLKPKS